MFRRDAEGVVIEEWLAPETGYFPLKQIITMEDGETLIVEAVNIEFRPVSDKEITPRPELMKHVIPE